MIIINRGKNDKREKKRWRDPQCSLCKITLTTDVVYHEFLEKKIFF